MRAIPVPFDVASGDAYLGVDFDDGGLAGVQLGKLSNGLHDLYTPERAEDQKKVAIA
jgi:hypothetical protein